MVILTEGYSVPEYAKTAMQLLRYREADVAAVLDRAHVGSTAEQVFGVGGSIDFVDSTQRVADADSLFIGIAPQGGRLPAGWRRIISKALDDGLHVVSGLHTQLADDLIFAELAERRHARILDIRNSDYKRVADCVSFPPNCVRVHTVGTDCSVGKMSTTKELELALRRRGRDAAFLATGQTGVMIGGGGIAIDGVVSDFVSGAAEQLVLDHQHHELLLIEGQGGIVHPSFSAVTTGLLHGTAPDALILCHEAGRDRLKSLPHVAIGPLAELRDYYERVASTRHPCRVIGVSLNGRNVSREQAVFEQAQIKEELGLPVCDVYRDGPDRLVEAVLQFDEHLRRERSVTAAEHAVS